MADFRLQDTRDDTDGELIFSQVKSSLERLNKERKWKRVYLPGAEATLIKKAVPPGRGSSTEGPRSRYDLKFFNSNIKCFTCLIQQYAFVNNRTK